jgi:glyoxylase-like metal-dependent hydrolase (beta-lactamase superfamily II)
VVDDEFAPLVPKILTAIGRLSSKPVRFVVNTHWHGDHTGGNAGLGAEGAVIVAQDNVRKRMSTEQFNAFFKRTTPPSPAIALPIVTFAEGVRFYLDGEDIEVTHIGPGHTDGDSTVWFHKANVIHMGDNFFNGMYPAIDGDAGGSLDGMVTALEGVLGRIDDQTKVIPGHGPLGTKADLKRFHDMLVTIGDRVRQAIHDGKTQDQVLAMKPSADLDAVWGNGFLKPDFFVTLVYVLLKP